MPIDAPTLRQLLRTPDYAGLSDADAAALASVPILTPRGGKVTFTSLGNVWGLDRTVAFRAGLKALAAQTADPTAAATADYAIGVLTGDGFDPGHPEAQKAAAMFVAANLCTDAEARDSQYTVSYPAGDVVSEADVTAARAAIARDDAIDAAADQARGVWAAFENEKVNPAKADPALPVPTYADFLAMAQAAAGGGE